MNTCSGQTVADLGASPRQCESGRGRAVRAPKSIGIDRYRVTHEHAGAIPALYKSRQPQA
jgi:hypothetical protein